MCCLFDYICGLPNMWINEHYDGNDASNNYDDNYGDAPANMAHSLCTAIAHCFNAKWYVIKIYNSASSVANDLKVLFKTSTLLHGANQSSCRPYKLRIFGLDAYTLPNTLHTVERLLPLYISCKLRTIGLDLYFATYKIKLNKQRGKVLLRTSAN